MEDSIMHSSEKEMIAQWGDCRLPRVTPLSGARRQAFAGSEQDVTDVR